MTFWLPKDARPCERPAALRACAIDVGDLGLVRVRGRSREAVFETGALLLRDSCAGLPAQSIPCTLYSETLRRADGRDWLRVSANPCDRWTIILNAAVAFTPTGLDPDIPEIPRAVIGHRSLRA